MDNLKPSEDNADKSKSSGQSRVRHRNRMITSCLECRRRKLKCDKLHPCTNCSKFSRDCLFLAPALDSVSQQRLNEIKEKMGSLEKVLEQDLARREGKSSSSSTQKGGHRSSADLPGGESSSSDNDAAVPEDEKDLEPTPMAVIDGAYADDADDDILDLGVRVGKMRLNERLGGFFRPRIGEELSSQLNDAASDRRTAEERQSEATSFPDQTYDFLAPGPSYIAPGSGFLFGDVGSKRSLINFLPAKGAADILVRKYYENVHFIARVVHWPSFQLHYDNFWIAVLAGLEPPPWQQSLVFSILFSAVASVPEADITTIFGRPQSTILANFQLGTEVALSKAQFLRATKLETLQALIIYLIPMCRDQVSRAHSVLVGMAVRLAECMGLHRDPQDTYGLSPVDCHVRRIAWFQLCHLDFRTCEGHGPRPAIKREDYDTKFPLNINDAELLSPNPRESKDTWTDMTVSRIRFECIEMQRVVWHDRIRLEKKKISLTHLLGKVESFRRAMESKYNKIFDLDVPIQKYAQLVMNLMIKRLYIMILHRYLHNQSNRIPERLQSLTIRSAVQACETAMSLERIPGLSKWTWYNGAYQQWHMAFLLLSVIYADPDIQEADRVYNIIDYVFEPDLSLSRAMKARTIIAAIRDRTTVYRELRKVGIPTSMKNATADATLAKVAEAGSEDTRKTSGTSTSVSPRVDKLLEPMPPASLKQEMPASTAFGADNSWSFDKPSTFYVTQAATQAPGGSGFSQSTSPPMSQHQSFKRPSTSQQQHQQPFWPDSTQASPGLQNDFNSPSDSGTNESWPPLISADQVGWQTVLGPADTRPPVVTMHSMHGMTTTGLPPMPESGNPYGLNSGFPNDQVNIPQYPASLPRGDSVMMDINWAEWDQLFPPNTNVTSALEGVGPGYTLGHGLS
ncbi:hypothetical protein EDD37DRAFT_10436 [Exophiala viscosa]|uniref:Zn(2)-C6 fungal-type domain-containing protein n=1 Tax=Exophiala viscosa TaxID=2486360 RepID=A0AAN6DJQ2_9EURO|nr:hypothetical protein EDD36DRAFT_110857 [Exophiala viscosa]KAI1628502.1 hypothetical protein EDD37DRAFT_10436 [Exophiala viscosa]